MKLIAKASSNGGFIDQKEFKTAGKYIFDYLFLTKDLKSLISILSISDLHVPSFVYQQSLILITYHHNDYVSSLRNWKVHPSDVIDKLLRQKVLN